MPKATGKELLALLESGRNRALNALRDAIKDCPTCGEAGAIICTDCEQRYVAALNPNVPHRPTMLPRAITSKNLTGGLDGAEWD